MKGFDDPLVLICDTTLEINCRNENQLSFIALSHCYVFFMLTCGWYWIAITNLE